MSVFYYNINDAIAEMEHVLKKALGDPELRVKLLEVYEGGRNKLIIESPRYGTLTGRYGIHDLSKVGDFKVNFGVKTRVILEFSEKDLRDLGHYIRESRKLKNLCKQGIPCPLVEVGFRWEDGKLKLLARFCFETECYIENQSETPDEELRNLLKEFCKRIEPKYDWDVHVFSNLTEEELRRVKTALYLQGV